MAYHVDYAVAHMMFRVQKCISALNQSWHPEHFLCAACGRQFDDEGFHEKDGLAYCRSVSANCEVSECKL